MGTLASKIPEWLKKPLRGIRRIIWLIQYRGKGRYCPVCGKSFSRFKPFGIVPREDAQCVNCQALERHRFLWLFLQKKTDFFNGRPKKMLHIAPEPCFESRFKERLGENYLTADLYNPQAMVKMDITDIQYNDQSFDVIYCSHVLEHVQDDKKAMREFYRVLKKDGWAILQVPMTNEPTFEDSLIIQPAERLRIFGQEDHVRAYGPDYVDRLRDAGFTVGITRVTDLVDNEEAIRMGLTSASDEIYYCTK
jgi:SAM-dependent methyltransferase